MIFLTVGNPTQQFNRLLKCFDELVGYSHISQGFIQRGYSDYLPRFCEYCNFLELKDYQNKISEAKIVITHGGEGSIINCLISGKKPIVVPRLKKFGEHCNDHQLELVKELELQHKIYAVYEIDNLFSAIGQIKKENYSYDYEPLNNTLKIEISNYLTMLEEKYK